MRREWIEIQMRLVTKISVMRLPPCGGSGLKLQESFQPIMDARLPPCGGSGLKCTYYAHHVCANSSPSMRREWIEIYRADRSYLETIWSPSMRREWIEISGRIHTAEYFQVSLHAEGVD